MCLQNFDEATLEAKWVVNSETGEQYLLDLRSGSIIATRNEQGEWVGLRGKNNA